MQPIRFGLFSPQVGVSFDAVRERSRLVDRLGYDSIWFVDHFWSRGLPQLDHLEAWTLMAAVAATTDRLRIGTLVGCNSYRNPALVAKMACTIDDISHGRFLFGLGAGWMDEEYRAYGYDFPPIKTRLDQLDEALHVIRRMWGSEPASFSGVHYRVEGALNLPRPVQQPHPPILIGGAGERRLLKIVAEHANIWNCPNNVAAELSHKRDVLRRHCDTLGRNFDEIEISEQCVVVVGKDEADLNQKLALARGTVGKVFDIDTAGLVGTPEQLIDRLRARVDLGVTFFTMMFGDLNGAESIELFAEQVMPAFAR